MDLKHWRRFFGPVFVFMVYSWIAYNYITGNTVFGNSLSARMVGIVFFVAVAVQFVLEIRKIRPKE